MIVLGIETSCDETSAAIVEETGNAARPWRIRSNIVASQVAIHREWGGVVPELSARQHIRDVCGVVERALDDAHAPRIDAVAVTLVLIGVNVLVYLAELAAGGNVNGTGNWIYNHGVLFANGTYSNGEVITGPVHATIPPGLPAAGVSHGEWWRLMTAAFLHYGPVHLALNMFSLYFAGSILEQVIGRWRYLLLYLVSGLVGSAGRGHDHQVTLGLLFHAEVAGWDEEATVVDDERHLAGAGSSSLAQLRRCRARRRGRQQSWAGHDKAELGGGALAATPERLAGRGQVDPAELHRTGGERRWGIAGRGGLGDAGVAGDRAGARWRVPGMAGRIARPVGAGEHRPAERADAATAELVRGLGGAGRAGTGRPDRPVVS